MTAANSVQVLLGQLKRVVRGRGCGGHMCDALGGGHQHAAAACMHARRVDAAIAPAASISNWLGTEDG